MSLVEVKAVSIDAENRVRVFVRGNNSGGYEHIHRTASGVRWDRERQCLYSDVPRKLSHSEWFEIIRHAVHSEYGDRLVLSGQTIWDNVPFDIRAEIRHRIEEAII